MFCSNFLRPSTSSNVCSYNKENSNSFSGIYKKVSVERAHPTSSRWGPSLRVPTMWQGINWNWCKPFTLWIISQHKLITGFQTGRRHAETCQVCPLTAKNNFGDRSLNNSTFCKCLSKNEDKKDRELSFSKTGYFIPD